MSAQTLRISYRLVAAGILTLTAVPVSELALLYAQTAPPAPTYKYEVASIRRADPNEMNSGFSPGAQGGMRVRNNTALGMLAFAYNARDYQFVGVPGWANSERFDINFTPDQPDAAPGSNSSHAVLEGWLGRQRQRLQAILHDRFGLVLHIETKELPIYALTVAKSGHKLSVPAHPERGESMNINRGQQIIATAAPPKSLAVALSMLLGRPVHDETGVDGVFDFKLEWAPESTIMPQGSVVRPTESSAGDSGRTSIFTALTEQLGLRLESKKGPVPVYVIDKIERPSEN